MTDEEILATALLEGTEALRLGRPGRAAERLALVVSHSGLNSAPDMADVRVRARSLYAQALLESGRPTEAEPPVLDAMRELRAVGDSDGLQSVRGLHKRVREAIAAEARDAARREALQALSATPLPELRQRARTPFALAELLVQRANADAEVGQPQAGLRIAREALGLALELDDVRLEVLARLSVARCEPDTALEQLEAARARADGASEFNLVGAVARAAAAHGLQLSVQVGPDMSRRQQ